MLKYRLPHMEIKKGHMEFQNGNEKTNSHYHIKLTKFDYGPSSVPYHKL